MKRSYRQPTKHAVFISMTAFLLAVLSMSDNAIAANDGIAACVQEKVAFDGITPLKYADVIGGVGTHVALNLQHPTLCKSTSNTDCTGKAFLMPGDTVAVANTCGDYAHVQLIGEKRLSL